MSLYRQARGSSRWVLAGTALVAIVAGGAIGFALGRSSAPEQTLSEQVAAARAELRPALSALELVTIEYPEAVSAAGEIEAETEYEAARAQAAIASDTLEGAQGLAAVNPAGVARAAARTAAVRQAIDEVVRPDAVEASVRRARAAVSALVEGGPDAD